MFVMELVLRALPRPTAALDEKRSFVPPALHARSEIVIEAAVYAVTAVGLEPLALMTQTFWAVPFGTSVSLPFSGRADRKAIWLPSGDHTALKMLVLLPVSWVRGVMPVPSGLMTQMFWVMFVFKASVSSSLRLDRNRILVPSGDHAGKPCCSTDTVPVVNGLKFEPPASTIQMFLALLGLSLPSSFWSEANTNRRLFGDQLMGRAAPAASAVIAERRRGWVPSAFISQMLVVGLVLLLRSSARAE